MPFVTEEIYHLLAERAEGDDLCVKQFEKDVLAPNTDVLSQGEFLKTVISEVRNLRLKASFTLYMTSDEYERLFPLIGKMTKALDVKIIANQPLTGALTIVVGKNTIYVQSDNPIDTRQQKEDLLKELKYQQGFLESVNKKLSNEKFVGNAKPEVIELERKKKSDAEAKIKTLEESLGNF
jgi:valyl-tRNA synthetase